MEYQMIVTSDVDELNSEASRLLACGWTPQGGVSMAFQNGTMTYAQAFVLPFSLDMCLGEAIEIEPPTC